MQKILVSSCLLGCPVRYDGGCFSPPAQLLAWQQEGRLLVLCPEVAGGLPTPRAPAELQGGDGVDFWQGNARVLTQAGEDVSDAFRRGAQRACQLVQEQGIGWALLKARSPSCGNRQIYDGQFRGQLRDGLGVTASALQALGVRVFNEQELDQLVQELAARGD